MIFLFELDFYDTVNTSQCLRCSPLIKSKLSCPIKDITKTLGRSPLFNTCFVEEEIRGC